MLLDDVKAKVEAMQSKEESAVAFIRGFVDKLREAFNNNDIMTARHLTDEAHSRAPEIAEAINANAEQPAE